MVKINFAGYDYSVTTNIISISGITFDLNESNNFPNGQAHEQGELARLYLDTLPVPQRTITDSSGNPVTIPEKKGIDLSTATIFQLKSYLNDVTIPKSNAVTTLVKKILYLKSPSDIDTSTQKSFNDEQKTATNIEFLGRCGLVKSSTAKIIKLI